MLGRRSLLRGVGLSLATLALGRLALGGDEDKLGLHHAPRAKRVVHLFQSGGPSQFELFDHKPLLQERNGEELPDSVRRGQRLTGMSGNQATLPLAGAQFEFSRHGQAGTWMSELVPHTAAIADDICIIRSMQTEQINHDPAPTFTAFKLLLDPLPDAMEQMLGDSSGCKLARGQRSFCGKAAVAQGPPGWPPLATQAARTASGSASMPSGTFCRQLDSS